MNKKLSSLLCVTMLGIVAEAQQGPWQNDLMICQSTNGLTWTNQQLFVDSAGVPTVIKDTLGRLVCAFQWFPGPVQTNPNFDKVAIKISTDNGATWTNPIPAVFSGMGTYTRPFDPTLVPTDDGKIRMYFSSSVTGNTQLDSTVHTYSAISTDGINYVFEPGIRVAVADSMTIDPAVVKFSGTWHYTSPRNNPQDGAFHFTSPDGLNFTRIGNITSDSQHQWTGNLMKTGTAMGFIGAGTSPIWINTTNDGNTWNGYVSTGVSGGDPAAVKVSSTLYYMIYVGLGTSGINEYGNIESVFVFPNPSNGNFELKIPDNEEVQSISVTDISGNETVFIFDGSKLFIDAAEGIYFVKAVTAKNTFTQRALIINK